MLNTAQRVELLLAILSNLKRYDVVALADLANQLKMDQTQLHEELTQLMFVGVPPFGGGDLLPIQLSDDGFIYATGDMPALNQALRLTEEEATALTLALRIAGFQTDDPLVTKLTHAVTMNFEPATVTQIMRICQAQHDMSTFTAVSAALEEKRSLQFDYRDRAGTDHQRRAQPKALFAEGGSWYLHALDLNKQQGRNFRIDRISNPTPLNQQKQQKQPSEATPQHSDFSAPRFDPKQLPYSARIKFHPASSFIPADWPGATRRAASPDGSCAVDVPYSDTTWLAHKIMSLHGRATVAFPPEVADAVARAAQAKLAQLSSPPLPDEPTPRVQNKGGGVRP